MYMNNYVLWSVAIQYFHDGRLHLHQHNLMKTVP